MKLKLALPAVAPINVMPSLEAVVAETTKTIRTMPEAINEARVRSRSVGALHALDNRTLEDIGVPRADIIAKSRTRRRMSV